MAKNQMENKITFTRMKDVVINSLETIIFTYKGCHSNINHKITLMLVRGVGIRDISKIEEVSTGKVLTVLVKSSYSITPKRSIMTILKLMNFGLMFRKKRTNNGLYMLMTEKHGKL